MKRREIVKEAKHLIADQGAWKVLEFGDELFLTSCPDDDERYPFRDEIVTEARSQAYRVLDFLGLLD